MTKHIATSISPLMTLIAEVSPALFADLMLTNETPIYCPDCNESIDRHDDGECPPTKKTLRQIRDIAAQWHGGQATALYALASTGTITSVDEVERECRHIMAVDGDVYGELLDILDYVRGMDA